MPLPDEAGALRLAFAALVFLSMAAVAAGSWTWGHVPHVRRWFAAGCVASVAFLAVAAAVVLDTGLADEDVDAIGLAQRLPGFAVRLAAGISTVGSALVVAPLVVVTCAVLWRRGRHGEAVRLAVAMALSSLLASLLKVAFARERPEEAVEHLTSLSFPSGHTTTAAALATWLVRRAAEHFRFRPAVVIPVFAALAWVALMAASRVALRVHYYSDVLGGAALGAAVASFVFSAGIPERFRGPDPGRVDAATVTEGHGPHGPA